VGSVIRQSKIFCNAMTAKEVVGFACPSRSNNTVESRFYAVAGFACCFWDASTDAMPFQLFEFAIDSDAAYQTAFAKAEGWVKEHPNKDAAFTLGSNAARFHGPVWFVLWGNNKSGYAAFVNATTGAAVNAK